MVFKSNPIIKVYEIYRNSALNYEEDSILIPCPEMVFHTTKGEYLGFETEDSFITVGANGIKFSDSKESFSEQKMYIDDLDEIYTSWETTVFYNEQILYCDFEEGCRKYNVQFTNFTMSVFCYDKGLLIPDYNHVGVPIKAAQHCIKRNCECGGVPEIMLDFVNDFYVKCNKCGAETWHTFVLKAVIDDWDSCVLKD